MPYPDNFSMDLCPAYKGRSSYVDTCRLREIEELEEAISAKTKQKDHHEQEFDRLDAEIAEDIKELEYLQQPEEV